MNERLKHQGRLAEKELEVKGLVIHIKGLVTSMRDLLDPLEKCEDLKADIIADQALNLATAVGDLHAAQFEIKEINKVLGRD